MADADEASSALIAQLLAQDYQQHAGAWGSAYYDDEDFDEPPKKKKKRGGKKGGKKKAAKPKKVKAPKPPKPPKVDPNDPRRKFGKWDEEEERLFLEALELHGRDWHKCVEYMNYSRDRGGFTSHAQKYFIKLYKENKPLPAKVAESGEGYTLSGKPLDPDSAAARAYGAKGAEAATAYREVNKALKQEAAGAGGSEPTGNRRSAPPAPSARPKPRISHGDSRPLKGLIDVGGLKPGPKCLAMTYKANNYEASLAPDGTIYYDKKAFVSPSAFALYIIHLNNPSRKAVNGWMCVSYGKEKLCDIQARHIQQIHGSPGKSLSARAKNDILLNLMKEEGAELGQKTGGQVGQTPEQIEAHRQAVEDARRAKEAAKKAREEKVKEELRARAEKKAKKEAERNQKIMEKEAEERRKRAAMYGSDGRTEYSRRRGRRVTSSRFKGDAGQSLQFVQCRHYGSGECCRRQPFTVEVDIRATLLVDLHAHLTTREIIGYLVGTWDAVKNKIIVKDAYPGRSIAVDSGAFTEAEMDPVAEVELRTKISAAGLSVVGWYHSHPTFQPTPSMVDIANQCNYQHLFHDNTNGVDPFIGMIVGPYDTGMPSAVSRVSWYYAESPGTERMPMSLQVSSVNKSLGSMYEKMEDLVKRYRNFDALVDFNKEWRNNTVDGGKLTFFQTLMRSLESRVKLVQTEGGHDQSFTDSFLEKVRKMLKENFPAIKD